MKNAPSLVLLIFCYYIFCTISIFRATKLPARLTVSDSEGLFAAGRRASLDTMDSSVLILIPGISDTLSGSILSHRTKNKAVRPLKTSYWEGVKGIGKKKASVLVQYIY